MSLFEGDEIDGYRVEAKIGEGGMGAVYRARDRKLGRFVAIKTMHPGMSANPEVSQRFDHEGMALGALSHSHITTVYGTSQLANGTRCIVMEYLEGASLKRFVKDRGGRLSPEHATRYLVQVLDAIGAAHDAGIIHRDLKPENVFLTSHDGDPEFVKVLDFGVAKFRTTGDGMRTRSGLVLGTPFFMSPEQLMARPISATADIYAVGVMAYLITTGRFPYQSAAEPTLDDFERVPFTELAVRMSQQAIPDARLFSPEIPEPWARVLYRMLDLDRAKRPQTAREAARLLAAALGPTGAKILARYAPRFGDDDPVAAAPASHFLVGEKIGEGGMAQIYRGTQAGAEGFSRPVAIKRVRPEYARNERFIKAFVEEAKHLSQLRHPNIVQVVAFERQPDATLLLVMDLVDGPDLDAVVSAGRMPVAIAELIVLGVVRALAYAHDRNIVHRDVSLRNILLGWDGRVYLGDFGLAREIRDSIDKLTATIRGTPKFIAPEVVKGGTVDRRADLWAVGVVLYELLAGQPPFNGSTVDEVVAQVVSREIKPPHVVKGAGRIPRDIEAIAMRLLERDPDKRYGDADEVIADIAACDDLRRIANPERTVARFLAQHFPHDRRAATAGTPSPDAQPTKPLHVSTLGSAASQSLPPGTAGPSARRSSRWGAIVGGVAAACTAGGLVFAIARRTTSHERSSVANVPHDAGVVAIAARPPPVVSPAVVPPAVVPPAVAPPKPVAHVTPAPKPVAHAAAAAPHAIGSGMLIVTVDQSWADCYVDGNRIGSTPCRATLSAGAHRLRVVSSTKREVTRTVVIAASKQTVIDESW